MYLSDRAPINIILMLLFSFVFFSNRTSTQRSLFTSLLVVWVTSVVFAFRSFLPFCCGITSLTEEEIESLRWMESWGFLVQGKMIS